MYIYRALNSQIDTGLRYHQQQKASDPSGAFLYPSMSTEIYFILDDYQSALADHSCLLSSQTHPLFFSGSCRLRGDLSAHAPTLLRRKKSPSFCAVPCPVGVLAPLPYCPEGGVFWSLQG